MLDKNRDIDVSIIFSFVLPTVLVILGVMLGSMNTFDSFKDSACINTYGTTKDYKGCNAMDTEEFTKKITVKE